MKNFYKIFGLITKLPFWRNYLHTSHQRGFEDLKKMAVMPKFKDSNFTALQCGTAGEITTDEFLKSVLNQNQNAKIIIIDLGEEQIASVKKLIFNKYSNKQIKARQANALDLSFIPNESVDWIETDGFLAFFDKNILPKLLKEWKRILKDDGFITFRDFASSTVFEKIIDEARIVLAKHTVKANLTRRTKKEMDNFFSSAGFKFSFERTLIPGFYRYCLVKSK